MTRRPITTRFAPSPTGGLHLGNARTALFSYLHARGAGGRFVLRIEDTDVGRSDAAHAVTIERELRWLGLDWDGEPLRQSERGEVYAEHLARLLENGRVYPCWRTEDELAEFRREALAAGRPPVYDRDWGRLPAHEIARRGAGGQRPVLRFRVPDDGEVVFQDLVRGEQRFPIAAIGDFVVQRSDGSTPFFFGNAVDDAAGGISDVLRGEDHLSNTPRQLLLLEALGLSAPHYGHLPLVVDADGAPLAKRRGAASLSTLEQDGFLPEAVVNYLARLGHSYDHGDLAGLDDLARGFRLERVGRSPAHFDASQLEHWQHLALQACDDDALACWAGEAAFAAVPSAAIPAFVRAVRANVARPGDVRRWAEILFADAPPAGAESAGAAQDLFAAAVAALDGGATDLRSLAAGITERTGARGRGVFRPLRLALTGREEGPELGPLLELMGPERVRSRLAALAVDATTRTDQA